MPLRRYVTFASIALLWLAWPMLAAAQNSAADIIGPPGANDLGNPALRAQVAAQIGQWSEQKRQAARARATQLGLAVRKILPNGRILEIVDFEGNDPVYFTTHNANAAISSGANLLLPAPYAVDGSTLTVGVWDGGGVRTTHQELTGRVTIKDGAALVDHSTHVGGTIAASGFEAAAKGMAPATRIDSYEWTNDKSEMTSRGAAYPGEGGKIYLSNHSYGFISGWNWTGLVSPRWNWYGSGTTNTSIEPDFGKYDTNARDTDSLAASLPYYLILRSAGNDRADNPAAGDSVSLSTGTSNPVTYNPATHPAGDGVYRGNGYDTVGFDAVAKNVLTVGSVGDAVSGGLRQPANAYMSYYSAWGPTDDGRIKPDVVANGESLYSSMSATNSTYGISSGTSMATPSTTGSAALVHHWWDKLFPGHVMRASTLKALLIHTADDLGNTGPDYQFGWGLINVKAAADLAQDYKNSPGTRRIVEDQLSSSVSSRVYSFTWNGASPIRATLCWTDPAGTATTSSDLRTARLVNNLNLRINSPTGVLKLPWVMPFVGDWTEAKLPAAATTGINNTDNVEQVLITAPSEAGVYTVTVNFSGSLATATQNFSLIVSGGVASVTAPAPSLTAISPTTGATGTNTLTVTGSGMQLGANVKLTKTGQADVAATGQEIRSDGAVVRVNVASGMASGAWNVVVTNPDGQSFALANAFNIPGALWQDDLETGAAGWTHSATSPYTITNWGLTTNLSSSPTHSFFAAGPSSKNIDDLYSPVLGIPAGSSNLRLTFWHKFSFQTNDRDGGVLEFAINGGTWFDVTSPGSGASFAAGGYNATLASGGKGSALAGRSAWSGANPGFTQVAVDLADAAKFAGKSLQIRWRLSTNSSTASEGWFIDDIAIAGIGAAINLPPSIVATATATPAVVTANSTQLTVGASDDGGEAELTYTWSATGGTFERPVIFSENGTNAAKNTTATFAIAGTYGLTVTVRDTAGLTATGSVEVTVDQTPASVVVAPSSATIVYGGTQAFTGTVLDQFTDPLAAQPGLTWGANGGTIDNGGLFTAGTVGGPFTITASSGGLNGTASVTVTKAPATLALGNLTQTYTGTPRTVTATTTPAGLGVSITYNGSGTAPSDFGSYAVTATITDPNYTGTASGTLTITGQPYADWQTQQFSAGEISAGLATDDANPDRDTLPNLAEWALGTDPHVPTPAVLPVRDANGLTLTFSRPKGLPGLNYEAESSSDLLLWTPLTLQVITDGPVQTVRVVDPMATGPTDRRMIRLRFTR